MSEQSSTNLDKEPRKEEFRITPIVYIILVKDDEILLIERNRGQHDGFWSLPAGHIEDGENARQTTVREAQEELGIDIDEADLDLVHLLHNKDRVGQRMILSLKPSTWEGVPTNMEPHKHSGIGWFPISDLPDAMKPYTKDVINDISNGVMFRESNWPES